MVRNSVLAFVLVCLFLASSLVDEAMAQKPATKNNPCKVGEVFSEKDSTETLAVCYRNRYKLPVDAASVLDLMDKIVIKVTKTAPPAVTLPKVKAAPKKSETQRDYPGLIWDFEKRQVVKYASR